MALCNRAASVARTAAPLCAARHYSALTLPLDEALPGASVGVPLPAALDPKPGVKVSTLKNGLKVASLETYSPVATVGLVVGSGSAYESAAETGASAVFRQLAFKSNKESSQFAVTRTTEMLGGRLHANSTRDHMVLLASATRDNLDHIVDVLGNEFTKKEVLPWEVAQARKELAYQAYATTHDPTFQALDLLHGAAFRGPLSNSLHAPEHRLNALGADQLGAWAAAKYVTGNAVLVGAGVQHEDLVTLAGESFAGAQSAGAAARGKSRYAGATEARLDAGNAVTHCAIGFEGAAAGTADALALGVAQYALGVGPAVKWGTSPSVLGQRLSSVMKAAASLTAFSASYADAGLFGIVAAAAPQDIGCAVGAARDALKEVASKGLSSADVARGKAHLKLSVLLTAETPDLAVENIGAQVLASGKYTSAAEMAKAIDGLSDAAVNNALKKALSSKPSFAAVGDLAQCPRLDDLA